MLTATRKYTFEAAHDIPVFADGHKCRRMHGHTYWLHVTWRVPRDRPVVPFEDVDAVVGEAVLSRLDHDVWNTVVPDGLLEKLACWCLVEAGRALWERHGLVVERVDLHEGIRSLVTVQLPDNERPGFTDDEAERTSSGRWPWTATMATFVDEDAEP